MKIKYLSVKSTKKYTTQRIAKKIKIVSIRSNKLTKFDVKKDNKFSRKFVCE